MKEKIARFRLKDYKITQSSFDIKPADGNVAGNASIEVERANLINEESSLFKLEMSVRIKDENESLNINIKIEGIFEFDSGLEEGQKAVFFNVNAPAILFPYVRAYVTAMVSLAGFGSFMLPTINFAARMEE